MLKKPGLILLLALFAATFLSACTPPEKTGQNSEKPPEELNLEGVKMPSAAMERYEETASQLTDQEARDRLFRDLLSWVEKNGQSSVPVYTNIKKVETALGSEWQKTAISSRNLVEELNSRLENPGAIKDREFRETVEKAYTNGLAFATGEGDVWTVINYHYLRDRFGEYISPELREYLAIRGDALNDFNDGGPVISWDQLADSIIRMEEFLKAYPGSKENETIKELYHRYLSVYLTGGMHMPFQINEALRESQQRFLSRYKNTDTYGTVKEYHSLLQESDFKKTDQINNYNINGHLPEYLQR